MYKFSFTANNKYSRNNNSLDAIHFQPISDRILRSFFFFFCKIDLTEDQLNKTPGRMGPTQFLLIRLHLFRFHLFLPYIFHFSPVVLQREFFLRIAQHKKYFFPRPIVIKPDVFLLRFCLAYIVINRVMLIIKIIFYYHIVIFLNY